jgi:hypothetical protein
MLWHQFIERPGTKRIPGKTVRFCKWYLALFFVYCDAIFEAGAILFKEEFSGKPWFFKLL